MGASSSLPVASKCSKKGTEFFANPDRAVFGNHEGFNIKVCTCEKAIARSVRNFKRNFVIWVAQLNEVANRHATITSGFCTLQARVYLIDSQQKISAVVSWHQSRI
jgi:hypothetical protein